MNKRNMLVGALSGFALQLAALGLHLGAAGWPLRPFPGCSVDLGGLLINAPALLVRAVVRIDALAPQENGKVSGTSVHAAEASWSPTGFVLLGAAFYTSLGLGLAMVVGAARARRP